jgi:hypothetical protein
MEEYDDVKYVFRFCNLEREAFDEIEKTLSDIPHKYGNDHREGRKTFVIEIEEGENYSSVFKLIKTGRVSEQDYGVFVSFTSNHDMTGIHFPEYVLEFIKRSGGQIDISIIFLSDESD